MLDQAFANGEAAAWAENRALTTLSREEALQKYPWERNWLWQQCTDVGGFRTSGPDGIWQRTEEDWAEQCQGLFGVELVGEHRGHRDDLAALEAAGVPGLSHTVWATAFELAGVELPE